LWEFSWLVDGLVVATARMEEDPEQESGSGTVYLEDIQVIDGQAGQGNGTRFLEALMSWARAGGFSTCILDAVAYTPTAKGPGPAKPGEQERLLHFYQRRSYTLGDAVRMSRAL